jgi:hypothetical protein
MSKFYADLSTTIADLVQRIQVLESQTSDVPPVAPFELTVSMPLTLSWKYPGINKAIKAFELTLCDTVTRITDISERTYTVDPVARNMSHMSDYDWTIVAIGQNDSRSTVASSHFTYIKMDAIMITYPLDDSSRTWTGQMTCYKNTTVKFISSFRIVPKNLEVLFNDSNMFSIPSLYTLYATNDGVTFTNLYTGPGVRVRAQANTHKVALHCTESFTTFYFMVYSFTSGSSCEIQSFSL